MAARPAAAQVAAAAPLRPDLQAAQQAAVAEAVSRQVAVAAQAVSRPEVA